ncbi:MAG: cysteine--tRNA ligase [Actinobacteria bacterium]|nr:cysteine--tRNA ligase [Actinomycetota bacterium]
MRLWDTALRDVVEVELRDPNQFSFYVCGPTVYGAPHVGHGRLLLIYDVLRRYLEWRGLEVRHVSNVTDIEDKIIAQAASEGIDPSDLAAASEAAWFETSDRLGVLRPNHVPHATEYVEKMGAFIGKLVASGHAYPASDGVYFEVAKLAEYGALLNQPLDSLRAGARVDVVEDKRAPADFALWKLAKPGEPKWPSPWGEGRPGWHIECTVMALELLGDGFDLHGAGDDLIFPHNENERAQAVAGGHRFARHWMHHGMLTSGGEKMSRSIGNVLSLDDALADHDVRALRLLVLRSHYRTPMEVTPVGLADTSAALRRLDSLARRIPEGGTGDGGASEVRTKFVAHMDDDLDTPGATAAIFDAVRQANSYADAGDDERARAVAADVRSLCGALGLPIGETVTTVDAAAEELVRQRDAARAAKDFARADEIKLQLESEGWVVEDFPAGTKIRRP